MARLAGLKILLSLAKKNISEVFKSCELEEERPFVKLCGKRVNKNEKLALLDRTLV